MPGFRVSMGFGLHVGWAIEGAIGAASHAPRLSVPCAHAVLAPTPQTTGTCWRPKRKRLSDSVSAGSEYKIDASYLSPNVNMASRLEAATKQFGAAILLSEDFVECLSPAVRNRVRSRPLARTAPAQRPHARSRPHAAAEPRSANRATRVPCPSPRACRRRCVRSTA
jgi:hypothetical protein